ncbi:MAG: hypothetical protein K6347_02270 [Campylobacterales bacterium]
MDRIFEPYLTTKAASGTGLGLYMAKMIIEKYQRGRIGVFNTEEGACFWVRLSLVKPS